MFTSYRKYLTQFTLLNILFLVFTSYGFDSPEPFNLAFIKDRLIRYHDSSEYATAINTTIQDAQTYLEFRINQNKHLQHPHKLAIALDIDETSLSNYDDLVKLNFGGTTQEKEQFRQAAKDPAITATLTLYNYAKKNGVAVFFITGRYEHERKFTIQNLKASGYQNWDGLLMKPDNYNLSSVSPYKTKERKNLVAHGYDVVFVIGDQQSDLTGGYADMTFKMPNPYYFTK